MAFSFPKRQALLSILFIISVFSLTILTGSVVSAGSVTGLAYTDDPNVGGDFGIFGLNTLIYFSGPNDTFFLSSDLRGSFGSAMGPGGSPAQMGGFNNSFNTGSNGEVFTATASGGGSGQCILQIANGHHYCGVTIPPPVPTQCPDDDGDGTDNCADKCPLDGGPASNNGCPLPTLPPNTNDRDHDAVPDNSDHCPDQLGSVSNNGCPEPNNQGDGSQNPAPIAPTAIPQPVQPNPNAACNLAVNSALTARVNVRLQPNTNVDATNYILFQISIYDGPFSIIGARTQPDGIWYQIAANGVAGWVRGDNVLYAGGGCDQIFNPAPLTPQGTLRVENMQVQSDAETGGTFRVSFDVVNDSSVDVVASKVSLDISSDLSGDFAPWWLPRFDTDNNPVEFNVSIPAHSRQSFGANVMADYFWNQGMYNTCQRLIPPDQDTLDVLVSILVDASGLDDILGDTLKLGEKLGDKAGKVFGIIGAIKDIVDLGEDVNGLLGDASRTRPDALYNVNTSVVYNGQSANAQSGSVHLRVAQWKVNQFSVGSAGIIGSKFAVVAAMDLAHGFFVKPIAVLAAIQPMIWGCDAVVNSR